MNGDFMSDIFGWILVALSCVLFIATIIAFIFCESGLGLGKKLFRNRKRKFIIVTFYKNKFRHFEFAKDYEHAYVAAKFSLLNTINYQAVIYEWDVKNKCATERIEKLDTFTSLYRDMLEKASKALSEQEYSYYGMFRDETSLLFGNYAIKEPADEQEDVKKAIAGLKMSRNDTKKRLRKLEKAVFHSESKVDGEHGDEGN